MVIFFIQQVSAQAMLNVIEMFKQGKVSADVAMQILGGDGGKGSSLTTPRNTNQEDDDSKRKHSDVTSTASPTKDSETASPEKKELKTEGLESWTHMLRRNVTAQIVDF